MNRPTTLKEAACFAADHAGREFILSIFSSPSPDKLIGQCVGFKNVENTSSYYPLLFRVKRTRFIEGNYEFFEGKTINTRNCVLFPQFKEQDGYKYLYIVKSLITADLIDYDE